MLLDKSISELATEIKKKTLSSESLVAECFANLEKHQDQFKVVITMRDREDAMREARKRDQEKPLTPLHGIPFVLKDSYLTKGLRTTAASKVLDTYIPQYNATVYQKLVDSGAILIAKVNMDAWGHGASGENTDYGAVANPYDPTRAAGGSGSGPATAISLRMCSFGISEDTGGSIRIPAAWTNTSGLKVTYGRVSRYGCIPYASSFDTVGPAAKTVEDLAIILKYTAGIDPYDATSSPKPVDDYEAVIRESPTGLTLGLPQEAYREGLDPEIRQSIETAIEVFKTLGVKVKTVSLPSFEHALAMYGIIARSETSSNLARYDGIRYGGDRNLFSPETTNRIMVGSYALSTGYYDAYYRQAQKVRTLIIEEYQKAFKQCDALLFPITPTPPTKLGELIKDPLANLLMDIYNCTQNPSGSPSLAVPCGFTGTKLPIGMQLTGPMFSESSLLKMGHAYQQTTSWHTQKPNL